MRAGLIMAAFAALLVMTPGAYAQDDFSQGFSIEHSQAIKGRGADIQAWCAKPDRHMPAPGKQFDGKPADPAVLALKPGTYDLKDGGSIQIFDKGVWQLHKSPRMISFFGPGRYSGGEIRIGNGTVGGCSLELLSALKKKNNMEFVSTVPHK